METKKIYAQLAKIMQELPAIGKTQRNQQQKFNFRGIDDIYNTLQPLMAKHGVVSVPFVVTDIVRKEVKTRNGGTGIHQTSKHIFQVHADDGSYVNCEAIGEGIDYGDKVSNKCASIAHKYALLQLFCIPTEEKKDPDFESHEVVENKPKKTEAQKFAEALPKMVEAFQKLGVKSEQLAAHVGVKSFREIKPHHMSELKKHYQTIKEELDNG